MKDRRLGTDRAHGGATKRMLQVRPLSRKSTWRPGRERECGVGLGACEAERGHSTSRGRRGRRRVVLWKTGKTMTG